MPIEKLLPPLVEWLPAALGGWAAVVGVLLVAGLVAGYLVAAVRQGPKDAVGAAMRVVGNALTDLAGISLRRVLALSWLAVKESIRKKVIVVFVIFVLILLLAGWFLDPRSTDPARLYISFVLTTTSYLVLILALFLSAFSLPLDISKKTLHTVVTKPVRASEIVLGRILGFAAVGTFLLALMWVLSYFFVVRGLAHTHDIPAGRLRAEAETASGRLEGETDAAQGHKHLVRLDANGQGRVQFERGHTHALHVEGAGSQARRRLGPPEDQLLARVPVYGKLQFCGSDGLDKPQGISVGDEWAYRSYIEGNTQEAAIWLFSRLGPQDFPAGLPVELNIGVFRSYKGNIERTVLGSLSVRNPKTGLTVETDMFDSQEYRTQQFFIPRKIVKFSSRSIVRRRRLLPGQEKLTPPAGQERAQEILAKAGQLLQRETKLLDSEDELLRQAGGTADQWANRADQIQKLLAEREASLADKKEAFPLYDFSEEAQLLAQEREMTRDVQSEDAAHRKDRLAKQRELLARRQSAYLNQVLYLDRVRQTQDPNQSDGIFPLKSQFDVFEDLMADGQVEIWLKCLDRAQYFGAGRADLYFRAGDGSVVGNFAKAYFGIWLQMLLVIGIGVMFSTFLSGPVAMIATLGALVGGLFREFMIKLAHGETFGGGPFESLQRIVGQNSLLAPLEPGLATDVTRMADQVAQFFLNVMSALLPPFAEFNWADYVAYGFDISAGTVVIHTLAALGFLAPVFVAGYLFLRNREVAR